MNINPALIEEIKSIIHSSKFEAAKAVDHQRVLMYWQLGKRIFEEEQLGKERADYGKKLIRFISKELHPEFGSGFSFTNLNLFRQFYRVFPIVHALRKQLAWTHYRKLIKIESEDKREFYIAETIKNH